jgi:gamma-glutamyltranspeptidase/glutathione hydrolase
MRMRRVWLASWASLTALLSGATGAIASHVPERARQAMVASSSTEASQAGVEIMRQGGNAVDAAAAVGFALAVTHPAAGNLGGGGFMLIRLQDGKAAFLDFREKAPAAARPDMYLDAQGKVIPEASLVGYKAIGVPGSVAGLVEAQKRYGKLVLATVMAPAIRLAEQGFPVGHGLATSLRGSRALARFPESRRVFQRDGNSYQAGEIFRQPDLARTLRRIARGGAEEFYRGGLARELAAAMQKGGGLITEEDLKQYEVKWREPLAGSYRGYQLLTAPPPSSGGIALLETLNILEQTSYATPGPGAAESIHWMTEAMRRAFADRAEFLGDPDFTRVPVRGLTHKEYAARLRAGIDPQAATPSSRVGHGEPAPYESAETTHYSIVDAEGNAVACTTTLNGAFGSGVTADGLGFLMNNEMDDFAAAPGVPNLFGLIQGKANEIRPGKRPLSSMTPTIVTRDGKLFLVVGSPGGPRIISTVLQVIANVIDFHLNVQQAVDAPRFHHQWLPDILYLEQPGFSPDAVSLLRQKGHTVQVGGLWSDAQAIMIEAQTGDRLGAGDSRGAARPAGY